MFGRTKTADPLQDAADLESRFTVPRFTVRKPKDQDEEERAARDLGARDGRKGVPTRDDHMSQRVHRYGQRGEETMAMVAQAWGKTWGAMRAEWCRLRQVVIAAEARGAALGPAIAKAEEDVASRERAYDRRRAERDKTGGEGRFRMGRKAYVLLMTLIFLVDAPLNAAAFVVFVNTDLEALILGSFMGVAIILPAHVLGIQLRNKQRDPIIVAGVVAVPLLFTIAIAIARTEYLEARGDELFSGWLGVVVVTIINITVYTAAVLVSYMRHDPFDRAIEEAEKEVTKARADRDAIVAEAARARDQAAGARALAAQIRAWGTAQHDSVREWAEAERHYHEGLMQEYCASNRANRSNPAEVIRALEEWPRPTTPGVLRPDAILDWTCHEWEELAAGDGKAV